MIPASFDYVAPRNLDEGIRFLEEHGDDVKVLAGGHSLIPLMRLRLATSKYLLDINRIPGLEYIRESDYHLHIGVLTRYADVEDSLLIQSRYAALSDAAGHIADPLVRNMGTVGGNICHSDPANDLPATMLALKATMVAVGPGGERIISAEEFFVGTFETALAPTEILREIRIPRPQAGTGSAYMKLESRAGDLAVVGVAARLTLDPQGTCESVGLGLTAVGTKVIEPKAAEAALIGKKLSDDEIRQSASLAAQEAQPTSDLRGTADYKREMVRTLAARALRQTVERALGET
jgi:carbon-monoxide dehydrogenase medium subunit